MNGPSHKNRLKSYQKKKIQIFIFSKGVFEEYFIINSSKIIKSKNIFIDEFYYLNIKNIVNLNTDKLDFE